MRRSWVFWTLLASFVNLFTACKEPVNPSRTEVIILNDSERLYHTYNEGVLETEALAKMNGKGRLVLNGYYKEYYESGLLKTLGFNKNGISDSVIYFFYPSGRIQLVGYLYNGLYEGATYSFYKSGALESVTLLTKDSIRLFRMDMHPDGSIRLMKGKPLKLLTNRNPKNLHLGESLSIVNAITPIPGLKAVLAIQYKENGVANIDTTVSSFQKFENYDIKIIRDSFERKGMYYYKAAVNYYRTDSLIYQDSTILKWEIK